MRTSQRVMLLVVFAALPIFAWADDLTSSSFKILSPVISPGGYATSADFSLLGIISPFALGTSSSTAFSSIAGFSAYPYISTPVIAATGEDGQVALSWSASTGYLGWTPTTYAYGKATVPGGPYTFASASNALSATASGLTNGTAYHFVVRVLDAFGNVIATSSEVSATPQAASSGTSAGGSGGGGGGGGGFVTPVATSSGATVTLSGRAYPDSFVTILKDAQVVSSVEADSDANFETSLSGLSGGSYLFSLYAEDAAGNRSSLLTFPVSVTAGATTNIGGIFIAPSISVDKTAVKQGDNIAIFGKSAPNSDITIGVHSNAGLFVEAKSDAQGAYLYNFDTAPLEYGNHTAISKAATSSDISAFGAAVDFSVGDVTVFKQKGTNSNPYDLNGDGRVNLIDFSIMVFWYGRTPLSGSGLTADLDHDGKVDLVDFSILASHWTG